ncbi:hypothetical protein BSL78_20735 [Apostichopus japonicus]|uniref:Uncharacterized protein n=1 Tax=Stichopus japonicus TaxID=307972 RepID=A0A2G8K380_STIJA|nr:hypothetical protein BSL78_20735 [Apostichopus japonicus]
MMVLLYSGTTRAAKRIECGKRIVAAFHTFGLKITTQANIKTVNYLDATLDLRTGTHRPFRKPNDQPTYVHCLSNHPPEVTKRIPESIGNRISTLSSNEEIFDNAAPIYNDALRDSGYTDHLVYNNSTESSKKQPRKKPRTRNIIWFNPPYSRNVKSNVGKLFFRLLAKHFPKGNKLHKIFNKNNVKLSYSCMGNMRSIINSHNNRLLSQNKLRPQLAQRICNCRVKLNCPLNGNCLVSSVIYRADVTTGDDTKSYIGLSSGPFKQRYSNHSKSFRHERYEKETELSKHIWDLKRKGAPFVLSGAYLSIPIPACVDPVNVTSVLMKSFVSSCPKTRIYSIRDLNSSPSVATIGSNQ